jgi:hypothetical protein
MTNDNLTIEEIIKNYKFISKMQTSSGDDRLFYLDEENNILYCFGPSMMIRQSKESAESERIMIMEYHPGGPYLQVGDNVYDDKIIRDFTFFKDHGIMVTGMILEEKYT